MKHDSIDKFTRSRRRVAIGMGIVAFLVLSAFSTSMVTKAAQEQNNDNENPRKSDFVRKPASQPAGQPRTARRPATQPAPENDINRGRRMPYEPTSMPFRPQVRRPATPSSQPTTRPYARRREPPRRPVGRGNRRASISRFDQIKSPVNNEPVDYGVNDVIDAEDGKAYRLRLKFDPKSTLYFTIQDEFIDRGGVPGLLTFNAAARDRVVIVQKMTPLPGLRMKDDVAQQPFRVKWTVDRFEIREEVMDEKNSFDSLKDLYPVRKLRKLGRIPGAKIEFNQNGWTGDFEQVEVILGTERVGPGTREKLSRTSQRTDVTPENLERLLDDIGSLILPRTPKKIGESWKRQRRNEIKNFGDSVIDYTFTLESVREAEGDQIAEVKIAGKLYLEKDQPLARRTTANTPNPPQTNGEDTEKSTSEDEDEEKEDDNSGKNFEIDRSAVDGSFTFNITKGRLVELNLRRIREMSAKMESERMGKMKLESGEAHTMRVSVSDVEPVKPIIVGGPKKPDEPEEKTVARPSKPRNRPTTQSVHDRQQKAKEYRERREKALDRQREHRERLRRAREERAKATTHPTTRPADDNEELDGDSPENEVENTESRGAEE